MTDLPTIVAESRARCGLGPKVEDPSTVRRLAGWLATVNDEGRPRHRTGLVTDSDRPQQRIDRASQST